VAADGTAKSKGTLIVAAQSLGQVQYFAKALITCGEAGDTPHKVVGTLLRLFRRRRHRAALFRFRFVGRQARPRSSVEIVPTANDRGDAGMSGINGKLRIQLGAAGIYRLVAAHEAMRASLTFEVK